MRRANPYGLPLLLSAILVLAHGQCAYDYSVLHETTCNDAQDDDGDGLTDCDDPDCESSVHCIPETDCQNGIDDEGDGLSDCADPDCMRDPICLGARPCIEDGVCEPFENCFWCPDCCPQCTLEPGHDYIAYEVFVPTSAADATSIGVDIDGDGVVDNGLGRVLGLFGPENAERMGRVFQKNITEGEFILLLRLGTDEFPTDPGVSLQLLPGLAEPSLDATEDNFTGTGHALIDPEASRNDYLCGVLTDGAYTTGPRAATIPFGLLGSVVYLPVENGRAESVGPITASLMPALHTGGGLTQHTVDTQLLPFLAVTVNDEIRQDPSSDLAQLMLGFVDAGCSPSVAGCADVVNNTGECAPWDGQPTTPPISTTELRCSTFVSAALAPDVDLNGDGINDVLSIGVKLNAMHISIDN